MDISRMNGRVYIDTYAMRPGFFLRIAFRKNDQIMSVIFDEKEKSKESAEYLDEEREMLFISEGMATELMNRLWAAGVRPVVYDSPGRIEAMAAHLSDSRRLNERLIPFVLEVAKGSFIQPTFLEVRSDEDSDK